MTKRITKFFFKLFITLRGDTGEELSRGPLSDRIRETAVELLSLRGEYDKTEPLLEIGVGEGILAEMLVTRRAATKVYGIDTKGDYLFRARARLKKFPDAFIPIMALGTAPPFGDGSFRRIVCINTLHNQPSCDEVSSILSKASALLSAEGTVVFDIRNAHDPLISIAYRWSTLFDPTTKVLPVRAYSKGMVKKELRRLGLRILMKRGIRYPFWPIPSAYVMVAKR
jgi:ubiquinone/menaquinone biosynthesis C-methylase UbiE